MSTMKFGPQWMRNASSQTKPPGAGEQPSFGGTLEGVSGSDPRNVPVDDTTTAAAVPNPLRYSREMMLELFTPSDLADGFIVNEIVFSSESLVPVCFTEPSEKEHELLAGPINSGSAKRYNNASSASNASHYQPGRQQSSLNYQPRNGNMGRSSSNGMYTTPRARARDSMARSSGSRLHGADSGPVVGEELAFGGSSHSVSDGPDSSSLWAHQSIARSSVGTFGADGIFRLGGDDDDGGEPLESHPQKDGARGGGSPASRSSGMRGDPASAADGSWAWGKAAGEPVAAVAATASAAGLQQQQQQQPSLFQENQLVEHAEQLKWWYRDPQGELQGPFTTSHMQEWHVLGYFPADLQVCHDGGAGFQLLSTIISNLGNTQSPFLLTALAFVSSTRSPISGVSTPATAAALSRAASSIRMPSADGDSAQSRASMHAVPATSSALVSEPLLPEARSASSSVSVSASAVDSPGADVLKYHGGSAQSENPGGPASQAVQLTLLLGEQHMLVNNIGEQQLFAVRLQDQHQQNLANLMQDLTQESNAIHYRAQIDRVPVQPEVLYALQQRAQTAEERLRYEYAQLSKANAQEIAHLEAKVDPVIKDIMVRDGAAYALTFINQRLQDLSAQIASENNQQAHDGGASQAPSANRDDAGADAQHAASNRSSLEPLDTKKAAESELASMAGVDDVQEKLEQISVSSPKNDGTRKAPASKRGVSKAKEGKAPPKGQAKPKGTSTQKQDKNIFTADTPSASSAPVHSEAADKPKVSPGLSSRKESAAASTDDVKDKSKSKSKNNSKTSAASAASFAGPAAPWSTGAAGATSKKPKKTLLQIQQEEEEAMKKRQLAEGEKRAQALSANPLLAATGSTGASYAGRLGSSNSASSASVGSSGLSAAAGGSSRYSLAAIMEEQSKELPKVSAGPGTVSISHPPAAAATIASRIAAATSIPPSSQSPPVFSWANTGASSTTPSSFSVGTSSNATNSAAAKKQQSTKPAATEAWGGGQKQQQDNSASKLPSMEFLEWCYSRLTSLRGIDVCKFIEVLLTFPPQAPESALEIISEQIYAYSQSLNGHDFAEDFAKRRRKDYANVRSGSAKSAPENWAQVLKSKPASSGRHAIGAGSSGYIRFILVQNRQGKTRLEKWYGNYSEQERNKLKAEVHRTVASRDQKHQSNFVEFHNHRIIYRRYAGLFFCFCVDTNDNELAYLEAIHLFVEILDSYHGNVCELDLVFNFYMVYAVLDEIILAGEIQETSRSVILNRLDHLSNLE
ncbi:AP-2 complex subunit sigma [Coemansia sp. RSA 1813]|nr:AP-2 complex subunit sigma [Coemansia sp. RSA 1843]KAJ2566179.1 AP-2 complex subunit sigma [Coemansia sp. RSA 1813]